MSAESRTPRSPVFVSDFEFIVRYAEREIKAARVGGRFWREFVAECEVAFNKPWDEIREDFDRAHKAGLTSLGAA